MSGIKLSLAAVMAFIMMFPGCLHRTHTKRENILSKDISISPDDRHILFSFYKNDVASIYIADIDGRNVKQLTFPRKESHLGAKFSPDGFKVLFLSFPRNKRKPMSHLYLMNINGSDIRQLTSDKQHITEAIFSQDSNTIYFLRSGYYGHYSPIAASHPHNFDVYSIGINGPNLERITNLNEYQMEGLSVSSDGKQLLFATFESRQLDKTLHFLRLSDPTVLTSFGPRNYRGKSVMCYDPQLSLDDQLITFHAWGTYSRILDYELFVMDVKTKKVEQLTRLGGVVGKTCFFHNKNRILFTRALNWPRHPLTYELRSINIDGSDCSKIHLIMPGTR